jgi:hypothetical protein
MITFTNGIDSRTREVSPQIAAFYVTDNDLRYCIIGTDYGHIHTTSGDVRTWRSQSGARRFLRQYLNQRG